MKWLLLSLAGLAVLGAAVVLLADVPLFSAGAPAQMPADLAAKLNDPRIDEDRFTALCAEALRVADPQAEVRVLGTFRVGVSSHGTNFQVGWENPWRATVTSRADAVWMQAQVAMSGVAQVEERGEVSEIVPLVRGEVDGAVEALMSGKSDHVGEPLVGDLWVIYAFNKPDFFLPVTEQDLQRLNIEKAKLRSLALENFRKLIPPVAKTGSGGTWMLVLPGLDGNFESSLLLLDEVWEKKALTGDGDPVVAVPARSSLFVAESRNQAGVQKVKDLAADAFQKLDHPVSKQLLIRRQGKWEVSDL